MGITALKSLWVFGQRPPLGNVNENPDAGPSGFFGGTGYVDGRVGWNNTRLGGIMWYGMPCCVIDQVPAQLAVNNIGASSVPVSGVTFPLVSTTGAGVTVLSAPLTIWASGNTIPKGTLALDGAPGLVNLGTALPATGSARACAYDPTKSLSRAVRVVSAGNDSTGTFLVSGYDLYGYPLSQLLTGAAGSPGTATTTKAFKFISSVMPGGTMSGSAITVGTTDVIGLPILASGFEYMSVYWNSAVVTAPQTGFTAGVTTSPSTNLLGDVRGTYALQAASNGTLRLVVFMVPAVANSMSNTGLFGQPQV